MEVAGARERRSGRARMPPFEEHPGRRLRLGRTVRVAHDASRPPVLHSQQRRGLCGATHVGSRDLAARRGRSPRGNSRVHSRRTRMHTGPAPLPARVAGRPPARPHAAHTSRRVWRRPCAARRPRSVRRAPQSRRPHVQTPMLRRSPRAARRGHHGRRRDGPARGPRRGWPGDPASDRARALDRCTGSPRCGRGVLRPVLSRRRVLRQPQPAARRRVRADRAPDRAQR